MGDFRDALVAGLPAELPLDEAVHVEIKRMLVAELRQRHESLAKSALQGEGLQRLHQEEIAARLMHDATELEWRSLCDADND